MRILHLAYEDPLQPGSGGGALRTREVNRRLAARHQITAVVAGYPGAQRRLEDGVRWVPIGLRTGKKLDQLSYLALVPRAVRAVRHDLVVEDFGPPWSVAFSPLFTRKPVVAMVNWFFTAQIRHLYRLPVDWVERAGLPLYHDFISMSHWSACAIERRLAPRPARVAIIPNGVQDAAFAVPLQPPRHFLFVGRLDLHQKGLDLLFAIYARIRALLGAEAPPLLVVGTGRDEAQAKRLAHDLVPGGGVRFLGRVDGAPKFTLMAQAHAVLMPSRYETFGIVGVESLAAAAPLVAFSLGPLPEILGPGGARLVPPFDLEAFAAEAVRLVREPDRRDTLRVQGRRWAQRYRWDEVALRQEAQYEEIVARARRARCCPAPAE